MSEEIIPKGSDEIPTNDNDGFNEDYPDDTSISHRIVDYINTKKGDLMLGRFVAILEQLAPSAMTYFEAKTEIQKGNPTIEYKKWWWLLIVRFLVVITALGSAIYLKYTNNLDSTTSLIIITVATVFFSFGRKDNS